MQLQHVPIAYAHAEDRLVFSSQSAHHRFNSCFHPHPSSPEGPEASSQLRRHDDCSGA